MTTQDIEIIPVQQLSYETSSHIDPKIKSKSNSNGHNLKNHTVHMNNLSITRKNRITTNIAIDAIMSLNRKIRQTKYNSCFLVNIDSNLFSIQYHF